MLSITEHISIWKVLSSILHCLLNIKYLQFFNESTSKEITISRGNPIFTAIIILLFKNLWDWSYLICWIQCGQWEVNIETWTPFDLCKRDTTNIHSLTFMQYLSIFTSKIILQLPYITCFVSSMWKKFSKEQQELVCPILLEFMVFSAR